MESQIVRRALKDHCGKILSFVTSYGGVDPETPDVRPDRANVKWAKIMVGLSMTALMEVSIGYLQVRGPLPTEFTLFCLALLLAFACFFVASCMYGKFTNPARVLQKLGAFLVFTGVFVIVAVPFPPFFKIITWAVYVISVAAILAIRYFNAQ